MGDIFGNIFGGGSSGSSSSPSTGGGTPFNMSSIAGGDITNIPVAGVNAPFDASTSSGFDPAFLNQLFGPTSSLTQTTDPTGSLGATAAVTGTPAGTAAPDPTAAIGGGTQSAGAPAASSGLAGGGGGGGGGDQSGGSKDPARDSALATLRTLLTGLTKAGGQNPWVTGGMPTRAEATAQGDPRLAAQLAGSNALKQARAAEAAAKPLPNATEAAGTTVIPQTTAAPTAPAQAPQTAAPSPTVAPGPAFGPSGTAPPPQAAVGPPGAPMGPQLPSQLAQLAILALGALGGRGGMALAPLVAAMYARAMQPPGARGRPGWPQRGAWRQTMSGAPQGPNAWNSNSFVNTLIGAESSGRNIFSQTDRDPAGPNSRASGYLQIDQPTWQQFAGNVPGARRWSRAIDAPPAVQLAVANTIPVRRWGQNTKDKLHAKFGRFNENMTLGQAAQRFGGGANQMMVAGEATTVESGGPPGTIRPPRRGPRMELLQPSE